MLGVFGDTATPPAGPAFAALIAQVNRFTGISPPPGYSFALAPFDVASVNLDPTVAITAVSIYQRRATDAYNQFHDVGSESAITKADAGFANPVAWVTANLADVTNTIQAYGDSLGIAPAAGQTLFGASSDTIILLGGAALALWVLTR